MTVKLPTAIYSQDQIGQLLFELQQYIGKLADAAVRSKVAHRTSDALELSPYLNQLIVDAGVNLQDKSALEQLHQELEVVRERAPHVSITLSALPNATLKTQLTEWFRANIHPQILLQFLARSDIGGGMVVRAGSKIHDFSFRRQLIDNKHLITEIANRVR